ncbi:MAG: BatD family protein [Thermoanaerobaculia bacterium]
MRREGSRLRLQCFALACLAGFGLASWLSAAEVVATIDRPEATVEDQLLLTVVIEGSRGAQPVLPEIPQFEVYPRGQSTQMSFINGRMSSSVTYNYLLVPKTTGVIQIGPVTAEIDGEILTSQPIQVSILEASAQPQQQRDLFITSRVSTTNPFVGQEVIYVWRFYRRVRIGDARLEPQEFQGFLVEDLGEVREYQTAVNGVEYLVSEIRKALFPQEVGSLVIPASRLTCEVLVSNSRRSRSLMDDFFGSSSTETKVLRSSQIDVEVRPLPPPPAGFSGLVGSFTIDASMSKQQVTVGESATLRLTVSGSGNVQLISEPELADLPAFKIYGDQPERSINRNGRSLSGSRSFSKALVPLEPGNWIIPPVSVRYFDPETATFKAAVTAEIPLFVTPAEGSEDLHLTEFIAPSTGKVAVRILADDILPIYGDLDAVSRPSNPRKSMLLFLFALILPIGLYLSARSVQRHRWRLEHDVAFQRHRVAFRRARNQLQQLAGSGSDPGQLGQSTSLCLREYIGDKLGLEGAALTPAELDDRLKGNGVSEALSGETLDLLERLEAARFGAASLEAGNLIQQASALLKRLEGELKK